MRRHQCGEDCPRCQNEAEERRYGLEYDAGASDREADRYEREVLGL